MSDASTPSPATLPILVTEVPDRDGTKGGLFKRGEAVVREISADTLRESVQALSATLTDVFADIRAVGDFTLQEVRLQVEVSASGGVQLVGTAKAGGKGAITLTFRPPSDE